MSDTTKPIIRTIIGEFINGIRSQVESVHGPVTVRDVDDNRVAYYKNDNIVAMMLMRFVSLRPFADTPTIIVNTSCKKNDDGIVREYVNTGKIQHNDIVYSYECHYSIFVPILTAATKH